MFSEYLPLSGYFHGAPATEYVQPLPPELTEEDMADPIAVDAALAFLGSLEGGEDFMLNLGLVKPHTSWVVPQEYFDLYPLDQIVVPGLEGEDVSGIPAFILDQIPRGTPASADDARLWMQGYLASVSHADAQLGRLLDELEASGQFDNTNIVLWSDHGYHFGDHNGLWHKFTLWEEATRAPLVIKTAGNMNAGAVVDDVVSLVDIYPTLCDLAGLPRPDHLEGDSLLPLVTGQGVPEGDGTAVTWMYGSAMLRTATHAFIHYEDGSEELYDMVADPDQYTNLAGDPAQAALLSDLRETLFRKTGLIDVDDALVTGTDNADSFLVSQSGDGAAGGLGDDLYFVNDSNVTIFEGVGEGIDAVFTDVDFTLPENVELLLTKVHTSGAITVRANQLDNFLTLGGSGQTAYLGAGNDRVNASRSGTVFGEGGNDTVFGGSDFDHFNGGAGDDILNGGSDGDDFLFGGAGNDRLIGGSGDSRLVGGSGNDELIGGSGNEIFMGGSGADWLSGGEGSDFASYWDSTTAITAYLANTLAGAGDAKGDIFSSIENVVGTLYDDTIVGNDVVNDIRGNSGNDRLFGKGGADFLVGNSGNDILIGGGGADTLNGMEGNDTAAYEDATTGVTADLAGTVDGTGDAKGDVYTSIENLHGSNLHDRLYGDDQGNRLFGRDGNDRLTGRGGDDRLYGGAGKDLFVFHVGSGEDVVFDFEPGVDRLEIKGRDYTDAAEVLNAFVQQGEDAVLVMGGDQLMLVGIQVVDLTVDDIAL